MAGSLVGRRKLVGIALGMVRFLINGIFLEDLAVMGRCSKGWEKVGPESAEFERIGLGSDGCRLVGRSGEF